MAIGLRSYFLALRLQLKERRLRLAELNPILNFFILWERVEYTKGVEGLKFVRLAYIEASAKLRPEKAPSSSISCQYPDVIMSDRHAEPFIA